MPQLGPIMPWFSNGVWYVACRVLAAEAKALSKSPWLAWVMIFDGMARRAAGQPSVVGRPFQSDQVTGRLAAPLIASHSCSATTATRLFIRTTCALLPAGSWPTEITVEPIPLG